MIGTGSMTLEKVSAIRQIAADPTRRQALRDRATDVLQQIDQDAPVDPLFTALRSLVCNTKNQRVTASGRHPIVSSHWVRAAPGSEPRGTTGRLPGPIK
jgi:hypothetical protein